MAALMCKFCGRTLRSSAGGKLTYQGSEVCAASQSGKHVALPVPGMCVYCGRVVKTAAGGKLVFQGSSVCPQSPTKLHSLQD
jgi:ribosomal protein S27E